MSANCTKDFQITIGSPVLAAYWKFDEAAGTQRADSTINGNDISTTIGSISAVAGKISNAVRIPALDVDPSGAAVATLSFTPVWGGQSITIAGWIRNAGAVIANETQFYFLGNVGMGWRIVLQTINNNEFQAIFVDEFGASVTVNSGVIVAVNTYYFFTIILDIPSLTIGISVDDSAVVTAAILGAPSVPVTNEFNARNQSGATQRDLDELGIWYRKLTAAEITYLFNGNAGRTYPDVPTS